MTVIEGLSSIENALPDALYRLPGGRGYSGVRSNRRLRIVTRRALFICR